MKCQDSLKTGACCISAALPKLSEFRYHGSCSSSSRTNSPQIIGLSTKFCPFISRQSKVQPPGISNWCTPHKRPHWAFPAPRTPCKLQFLSFFPSWKPSIFGSSHHFFLHHTNSDSLAQQAALALLAIVHLV